MNAEKNTMNGQTPYFYQCSMYFTNSPSHYMLPLLHNLSPYLPSSYPQPSKIHFHLKDPQIGASRTLLTNRIGVRCLSTPVEPKEKANSIVDALPGNSLISKTGILATSAAAAIYGISNELVVLHDETILVVTFSTFVALCAKFVAPLYTEWADGEIKKVNDLLNESKNKHVSAVKGRIESVSQLKSVVNTTKQLFDISRETAKLEAETFELKQKVAVANEAKATLDSWVRFEQQQRQLEQEQLLKSVLEKVNKEVENPKFQDRVLAEAVAEVEKVFAKA